MAGCLAAAKHLHQAQVYKVRWASWGERQQPGGRCVARRGGRRRRRPHWRSAPPCVRRLESQLRLGTRAAPWGAPQSGPRPKVGAAAAGLSASTSAHDRSPHQHPWGGPQGSVPTERAALPVEQSTRSEAEPECREPRCLPIVEAAARARPHEGRCCGGGSVTQCGILLQLAPLLRPAGFDRHQSQPQWDAPGSCALASRRGSEAEQAEMARALACRRALPCAASCTSGLAVVLLKQLIDDCLGGGR